MGNLKDKNVLITGGSMGLGLGCARMCLSQGANVFICARNEKDVCQAVQSLKDEGYKNILGKPADVTSREELNSVLDEIEHSFGPVTSLIHSAGVFGPIGPITTVDPEEWFEGVKINLFGSFLVTRETSLRLQKTRRGRIVLFSGGGAGYPFPNYTSYGCSKAAIVRFTETIAQEMAPYHIQINCLSPGFVLTRLHQKTLEANKVAGAEYLEKTKQQMATGGVPIEVGASAAAFLISDEADGINGKFIAAPYDNWIEFPSKLKELKESDLFTLRRIVPKDRGMAWQ